MNQYLLSAEYVETVPGKQAGSGQAVGVTSGFSRSDFLMTHPNALPGTSPDTMDSPRPTTTSAYTSSGDPAKAHQIHPKGCKMAAGAVHLMGFE